MSPGELWEHNLIQDSRLLGYIAHKIPIKVILRARKPPIRQKGPFDLVISVRGVTILSECKMTDDDKFNLKSNLYSTKKRHQYDNLKDAWTRNTVAGVFLWFRKHDTVLWLNMDAVDYFLRSKQTVKPDSPEIPKQKYRYTVDVAKLCRKDLDEVRKRIALQYSLDNDQA